MKNQKGLTLVESITTIAFLSFLTGIMGGVVYVGIHFLAKFW